MLVHLFSRKLGKGLNAPRLEFPGLGVDSCVVGTVERVVEMGDQSETLGLQPA